MKSKAIDNAKLGLFVLAGILFLVLMLYMIGKNRNLLGATFTITATVTNVNGLVPGNNVRFKGIDVGTVKQIKVESDTSIFVVMVIDKKMKPYIKQNALATIGTDGLMGNRLININSQPGYAQPVEEGSVIQSLNPIETDEMLRTLNTTNNTIAIVTKNLQEITSKLNNSSSFWNLLADTVVSHDFKQAIKDIRKAGNNTAIFTAQAEELIQKLQHGEGLAGVLLTDTLLPKSITVSLQQIQKGSEQAAAMMADLHNLVLKIENGQGTAGMLLSDSLWREKLRQSLTNVEQGTSRFNENMEALKHNFLFRGYFRREAKAAEKK